MKILIYSDPHFCQYSSILRTRGRKYSTRLENLIKSLNWVENLAEEQDVDMIVCAGDFFNKNVLNSEEITALSEIKFSKKQHYFLVGNHDANTLNLHHNVLNLFKFKNNVKVINSLKTLKLNEHFNLTLIPYIVANGELDLKDYVSSKTDIVIAHQDLAGLQYGGYMSNSGFSIESIEENCSLFLNGHLHSAANIGKNIRLLGNLTGQNFTENAFEYGHFAYVLEIDNQNFSLTIIENPFALNFYKVGIYDEEDLKNLDKTLERPGKPVLSITCDISLVNEVNSWLEKNKKQIEQSRITTSNKFNRKETDYESFNEISVNYIEDLSKIIFENLGDGEIVKQELSILKGALSEYNI